MWWTFCNLAHFGLSLYWGGPWMPYFVVVWHWQSSTRAPGSAYYFVTRVEMMGWVCLWTSSDVTSQPSPLLTLKWGCKSTAAQAVWRAIRQVVFPFSSSSHLSRDLWILCFINSTMPALTGNYARINRSNSIFHVEMNCSTESTRVSIVDEGSRQLPSRPFTHCKFLDRLRDTS